jgi:hypothetical protein
VSAVKEMWMELQTALVGRLSCHQGLSVFARERAKFEAWLKVELCDVLLSKGRNPVPECDRIDVTFGHWAIELKTCNTNYSFKGARRKGRPITKNVNGVVADIEKLNRMDIKRRYKHRAVLFVVFPMHSNNPRWQRHHLPRIEQVVAQIYHKEFCFKDGLPGVLFFGLCK